MNAKPNSKKVLLFGYNQTNFLLPICKYVYNNLPNKFTFYAYGMHYLGYNQEEVAPFVNIIDNKFRLKVSGLVKGLLKAPLHGEFYRDLTTSFMTTSSPGVIYPLKKWLTKTNYLKEFSRYDIIHIHFCHPNFTQHVADLPSSKKLICSIWGSDILKTISPYHISSQRKAFIRADIITIQTEDLKKIFLGKYGSDLKPKIKVIQFGVPQELFENINSLFGDKEKLAKHQNKLGISIDKNKIVVGSNRSVSNNHLKIIQELTKLDDDIKQNTQLIIPFGYGVISDAYIEEVTSALNNSGFDYIILNEYLTNFELATLRLSSDIYIQMPETDALSATMSEFLYAGSQVIAGNWLPYSFFKNLVEKDNQLTLINNFDELNTAVIDKFPLSKNKKINKALLKVSSENILPNWADLYDQL